MRLTGISKPLKFIFIFFPVLFLNIRVRQVVSGSYLKAFLQNNTLQVYDSLILIN